ncbi:NAD-dependent epimerase/dehydratase family protein [Salinibacterium sp. SWN139]|uniref:NAD-dependent epimerase/dehydratase family protein n=1 Tax=Salinibacterium sp. SWN139 TaxID=2792055 RepID=UPI0018CED590|nr:NAD-dependent epimerase/dehydratase family protein [Salinibacterium sp. SWN139]MBH0053565.1 NAD-dependent epimerase/dehydratase family protein [Salinibacterium sp. SWN139]
MNSEKTYGINEVGNSVVAHDIHEILASALPWNSLFGKTVLVSGASGMIPSYVVYVLLALNDTQNAGINVRGLVRNGAKARAILGDVVDRPDFALIEQDVATAFVLDEPVDLIVHGASPARPALHSNSPVDTIRANVQGAFNLLDACVASDGAHFVLMSSAEVYGQRPDDANLVSEDSYGAVDILNPRACYTEGKRAAETIAVSYHAQYKVPITIARFGHIFGPGMALDDGRVQADFAADVIAHRDITLNSDGSARRTYTYLADAVAGMFSALLLGENTAYNISDRDGFISIRDLAHAFTAARPHHELQVRYSEQVDISKYNPIQGQGLDDSRLRALGWTPHVGLSAGLDRTIAWHEERAAR